MAKLQKTNAMRKLDAARIAYEIKDYVPDENDLSGVHIAAQIGLSPSQTFKTLVTRGDKTGVTVFCIPSDCEIDLKAAAAVTKNKKIEMLHTSELLATTGYIRGGCSPIGMKKNFPTYIDESALLFDKITVSSGTKGMQLLLSSKELIEFTGAIPCAVTTKQKGTK